MQQTVRVELGSRSYDIVIGPDLLQDSRKQLEPIISGKRVAVVSDAKVSEKYLDLLKTTLDPITSHWDLYPIQEGEDAKSFSCLEDLLDRMLEDGIITPAPGKRLTTSRPARVYTFNRHHLQR